MSYSLPDRIQKSFLIKKLKAGIKKNSSTFNFAARLDDWAERISAETEYVKLTFPEFTDHTALIHFPNLFELTTTVLGKELLGAMYVEELFVFAAALYGHDWGMAVSPGEKELILTGNYAGGLPDPLWLIPNEKDVLQAFSGAHSIELNPAGYPKAFPLSNWQDYVRLTHAERGATRAQRYFENIDGGVAQAVAALCKGHWLDIAKIASESEFPSELNVLTARIDLIRLALFVRLIDLFDIAENRTPFAHWRFLSIQNPISRREWNKHLSLRPVQTEPYHDLRCIVVDGTAKTPEVYADLLDLRNYCEKQLRSTCDLLARTPSSRLHFDIAPIIHWNVKPSGAFEPIDIRFEFDRKRMFEILGSEIYHNDTRIFIRELLQNAIDAIRMRRAFEKAKRSAVTNGLIHFQVSHDETGNCSIKCTDDGVGMDEYILKQYLAVAGKSYYRSADFSQLSLEINPISKFGIGILSCFMVSDSISILTCRDARFTSDAVPLRIEITHPESQWRLYKAPKTTPIGTSISVNALRDKLKSDENYWLSGFPVTKFLRSIAGFVEFPILVEENQGPKATSIRRTIILHPDQSTTTIKANFGSDVEIHQLEKSVPLDEIVSVDNQATFQLYFQNEVIDLKADLKLANCEGFIFSVRPKDESLIIGRAEDKMAMMHGTSVTNRKGKMLAPCLKSEMLESGYSHYSGSVSRSGVRFGYSIYSNGILVDYIHAPKYFGSGEANTGLPLPAQIRVNFLSDKGDKLSISRSAFVGETSSWDIDIWNALRSIILNEEIASITGTSSLDKTLKLYTLLNRFAVDADTFSEMASVFGALAGWQDSDGLINFDRPELDSNGELPLIPTWYLFRFARNLEKRIFGSKADEQWRGVRSAFWFSSNQSQDGILGYILNAGRKWRDKLVKKRIQFVTPCQGGLSSDQERPDWQMVLSTNPRTDDVAPPRLLDSGLKDISLLNPADVNLLYKTYGGAFRLDTLFEAVPFSPPFDHLLAYGAVIWNLRHPTSEAWIKACLKIMQLQTSGDDRNLFKILRFYAVEALKEWFGDGTRVYLSTDQLPKLWRRFWTEFKHSKLIPDMRTPPFPKKDDFVSGTWQDSSGRVHLCRNARGPYAPKFNKPWGEIVTKWPL